MTSLFLFHRDFAQALTIAAQHPWRDELAGAYDAPEPAEAADQGRADADAVSAGSASSSSGPIPADSRDGADTGGQGGGAPGR